MEDKICSRCILDTTVPDIWFDEKGVCKYCKIHDELDKGNPLGEAGKHRLNRLIDKIKKGGRGKDYDCVVGVSGGRDSTYTLYLVKQLGLRPLAVHFDNGWNSETAVDNIRKATGKLGVDLHTVVADWDEFRDLQVSFLKASVPDVEVPTDWAIYSTLFKAASDEGVKYVLHGHSFRTEGTSPIGWTYMDGRYVREVQRIFGKKRVKSFPIMMMSDILYHLFVDGIREVRLLEYVPYNQDDVSRLLERELGWRYYGGHHHESIYTEFVQSYLLPRKFNIDKRKTEYSALIRSGQMGREEALRKIRGSPYQYRPEVVDYCVKKLGFTEDEFRQIMEAEPKSFRDYPTYYPLIRAMRLPIRVACGLHLLPKIVHLKYAS